VALITSLSIGVAIAQQTPPTITSILNSASYTTAVAEGSLATIFGGGLATFQCTSTTIPYPQNLCGTSVSIDNQPVPLLYASPTQVNVQLPYITGNHTITVNNQSSATSAAITILDRAPGIFSYSTTNSDGTINFRNLAAAEFDDYSVHSPTNPLKIGTNTLTLYVNGLGVPTNGPAPALGSPAPGATLLYTQPITAYLNNQPLPASNILFAGYAPTLVIDQVNLSIPNSAPSGANAIKICAGSLCSPTVTVFMTSAQNYLVGNIAVPSVSMSDNQIRTPDTVAGGIISSAGTQPLIVNSDGNYLTPAQGPTAIILIASNLWESYLESTTVNGPTIDNQIKAFPHVTYSDVKGNYDRATGAWTNVGYQDPLLGWQGVTDGGIVTLLDMVLFEATPWVYNNGSATNGQPICTNFNTTLGWNKLNFPLEVYLDPTNQPYYNPVPTSTGDHGICPLYCNGTTPPNALEGTELLWQALSNSQRYGLPPIARAARPIPADEPGLNFSWVLPNTVITSTGATTITPILPCNYIRHTLTYMDNNEGTSGSILGAGVHELRRATGYGSNGASSPFQTDNESIGASIAYVNGDIIPSTARDTDGSNMVLFLGPDVDMSKYGQ